jgi:nicotinate-nucleotide adenylyltransferase
VLGGTFDPPHVGHLIFAQVALEDLRLDRVRFIPAGDPWRKAHLDVTPAWHRLEMVRRAVADNDAFEVDDCEVVREGATYTVDTLREMRSVLGPSAELYFLVGADALVDMAVWRDPAGIAAESLIAVAPREGVELPQDLPVPRDRIVRIDMPYVGVSSTDLRDRVRRGRSLRYLVPPSVEAYIRDNKLYL